MKSPLQFTIVLGLAVAGMALAASDEKPQPKSDAAAMREAIRFERAKDAADRRQLRMEAVHPSVPVQASEANRSEGTADRMAEEPQAKSRGESSKSDAGAISEAIRYEHFKDAAAARQMKLDARHDSEVVARGANKKQ